MEMAHLTDIQTAKVGIVLLLLQILAIIISALLEIIMFNLNLQGIQRELLQQQH